MSSFLYSLGRACYRLGWRVIALWFVLIALCAAAALALGAGTNDTIEIPGVESQEALEDLSRIYPEAAGTSAQVVVELPDGVTTDDDAARAGIDEAVRQLSGVEQIASVASPYDDLVSGTISEDRSTAIITAQYAVPMFDVTESSLAGLEHTAMAADDGLPEGSQIHLGGEAFSNNVPEPSATEAIGIVLALIFLYALFRSLKTAVIPLFTALIGVAVTELLIQASTGSLDVMATAPMLALMIGLAVGIDYALFIVSRYRDELREGVDPAKAAAIATATAGSAVVFAGVTVIIALIGLFVAGIPFLTIMGVAAALGVAMAIAVAVTAIPAILRYLGRSPLGRSAARKRDQAEKKPRRARATLGERWVGVATRHPVVTLVAGFAVIAVMALPAAGLQLSLPDNGSEPAGNTARDTYDLVAEEFGEGFNGPLIVTVDLLDSVDPVADMDRLGEDLGRIDGVREIAMATPEPSGSVGIVQVIPDSAPDSAETTDLVHDLRSERDRIESDYPVSDLRVTGITAVQADVSEQLSASILPFGIFVVGLSIVLLIMVFRSIIVPIKAALGYVLSLAAGLGITSLVFVHGVGADTLGVARTGSVVSFMPIILMAVLFGLAMDYEVFLVSRIAEARHRLGDAREAIRSGFASSAPVVAVAALIMVGVFIAFVPEDDATIKPIALALTVGVAVDAFIVRMTMVPAVLQLLGERAWGLPPALERGLPSFDVEGIGLQHQLSLEDWGADAVVAVRDLSLDDGGGAQLAGLHEFHAEAGELALIMGGTPDVRRAVIMALAGRLTPFDGDVKSAGYVLPNQAWQARRRLPLIANENAAELRAALDSRPPLLLIDDLPAVLAAVDVPDSDIAAALADGVCVVTTAEDEDAMSALAVPPPAATGHITQHDLPQREGSLVR